MTEQERLDRLTLKTIELYRGDARRIQHFLKVHTFAALIGRAEKLPAGTMTILEAAAIVHDIGIRAAEQGFGFETAYLQQRLGPDVARPILQECGYTPEQVDRICFLIAHHHVYSGVDGPDWQILLEADLLVNTQENKTSKESLFEWGRRIMKTPTGLHLYQTQFGL